MLKKIKKSIDTMFRFVLSLNETKRNEQYYVQKLEGGAVI